ncbi:outer membrane beta-barrel family protein [Sediminibacterium goheungense]|uniref:Outer membrane receptor protein involved in Fe transport n=1 Tax=Sediminibacterium goheungense TaxID=1086393 RepID=A0A4R6IN36_9BACT|nr:outer membrane beta-barrel family protein [Sediminibacterium goheungense]TDO23629.1 outer membrane receptor protein involved in Fe transport [Sediminibacterium goheungense]
MRNWRNILAAIGLVTVSVAAQAQTAKINGAVTGTQKPVEAASVGVLRAKDSAIVKMAVTDKTGQFEVEKLAAGKYLVLIQSVGYNKYYSPVFDLANGQSYTIQPITLTNISKELEGVVVTSKKPMIEQKLDRTIINVDASPTNAGATVLEVLEKSPGISVDKDGNISLKGKQGVVVLIDGKPTYLGAQDLANMLRNMSSSNLETIELMTNPPARFDASGNSGVINIKTKKTKTMGYNASITSGYTQGVLPKSNHSFNLNYRQNKINFFANASYNYNEQFGNIKIDRNFRNQQNGNLLTTFNQLAKNNRIGNSYNYKAGFDYFMNKKTTLGLVVNGYNNVQDEFTDNTTYIKDPAGSLLTRTQAINDVNMKFKNVGVNANLRHVFDSTGKELTIDADYINYTQNNKQVLSNEFFDHMGNIKSPDEILRGILPASINIYSLKADYSQTLKGQVKFEAGAKTSYVNTDNDAQYANWNGAQFVNDITRSNHFLYKENINAAYVNFSKQFSKKWSGQLGLRAENTNITGNQLTTGEVFKRNYTQVFPTAYIGYTANDKNQFALSYGRRIDRPNYQDLNPFYYFLDKYTYQVGNPYLRPQFSHNIELVHTYRGILNTSLNYSRTNDIIQDVLEQIDSTNSSFMKKSNIARRQNIGASVSLGMPVTKWFRTNVYVNVFYNHFKGMVNNGEISVGATSMMANISNQFTLPKGWGAELSAFYRTQGVEGVLVAKPMGAMNIGFTKQVLKNKGMVRLVVRDVLYTQIFNGYSRYQNVDVTIRQNRDSRVVNLSFTYRFSKGKTAAQRKRGGANEEQNRVNLGGGN